MGNDPNFPVGGVEGPAPISSVQFSILEKLSQQAGMIGELRRDVQDVTSQISALTKMMRGDGNGEKGLVMRVLLVERALGETTATILGFKDTLDKKTVEDLKGRWSIAQALVVAAGTLITTIISALLLRMIYQGTVPPHR